MGPATLKIGEPHSHVNECRIRNFGSYWSISAKLNKLI